MKIELNYFNEEFSIKEADLSKVQPFSHADVIVNCDHPLSHINGLLEREVEEFLSKRLAPYGIKARWDHSEEWTQSQRMVEREFPRINRLKLGINFDI